MFNNATQQALATSSRSLLWLFTPLKIPCAAYLRAIGYSHYVEQEGQQQGEHGEDEGRGGGGGVRREHTDTLLPASSAASKTERDA